MSQTTKQNQSSCACANCAPTCRCQGRAAPESGSCCCGPTCTCGPSCACPSACGCGPKNQG